jgi:hypothetical protein
MRARAGALKRKLVQTRGHDREIEAKRAPGDRTSATNADELANRYADAAADLESAETRVRSSEPWQLEVTAGIIPYRRPTGTASSSVQPRRAHAVGPRRAPRQGPQ